MSDSYFNSTDRKAVIALDALRTKRYTAKTAAYLVDGYVKLDTFIYADTKFLKIYKVPLFGPVSPVTDFTTRNSLNTWQPSLVNGVPGTSLLSDQIVFGPTAGISAGDTIDVQYTELPMVMPMATLGIKGWDFHTDTEITTDGDIAEPTTFNRSICTTGFSNTVTGWTISDIQGIDNGIDLPQENRVTYTGLGPDTVVHYYIPNCLHVSEWQFGDSFPSHLVLEIFKLPRQIRHLSLSGNKAGGHFNFQGHYTQNKMNLHELQKTLSAKIISRNGTYVFRFRNISTNEVSGWLPLKMYMKMRARLKDGHMYSRIVFFK